MRRETMLVHVTSDVPSGATGTYNISLPPGIYNLALAMSYAAATTDPSVSLAPGVNKANTAFSTRLPGATPQDTTLSQATDLELADTGATMTFWRLTGVRESGEVPVVGGVQIVLTKNGLTAIEMYLIATPL